LGTVLASGMVRTLQTKDRPTKFARALGEFGRLVKTLYLLAYIDNEAYRRRILNQLNRGEGRHQLARVVFHGKRGELRQRYREGQEDQLGALGLVVNVIILWNTIYMDAALDQLRGEGHNLRDEDVARLSLRGASLQILRRPKRGDGAVCVMDPAGRRLRIPIWMLLPECAEIKISQQPHLGKAALLSLASLITSQLDFKDRDHDNLPKTTVNGFEEGRRGATSTSGPD